MPVEYFAEGRVLLCRSSPSAGWVEVAVFPGMVTSYVRNPTNNTMLVVAGGSFYEVGEDRIAVARGDVRTVEGVDPPAPRPAPAALRATAPRRLYQNDEE